MYGLWEDPEEMDESIERFKARMSKVFYGTEYDNDDCYEPQEMESPYAGVVIA